jgi:molecular chaperone DnaK (HSP70)
MLTCVVPVALRGELIEGSEDGDLIVKGEDIAEIFHPVVSRILELIKYQIRMVKRADTRAKIAGIILVGGLGNSPYLFKRVKNEFEPLDYEVLRDTHA